MLINCPECNKEVSDKAEVCIHCGFPLLINNDEICVINNQKYNLSDVLKMIQNNENMASTLIYIRQKCNLQVGDALNLYNSIRNNNKIPNKYQSEIKLDNKPKCPKCKSTSITTGARGVNFTWGLIGASKTVNRCANCGHTWKP